MYKSQICTVVIFTVLFALPAMAVPPAGENDVSQSTRARVIDTYEYIDANKLLMLATNVGVFATDLSVQFGKVDGLYYPYRSIADIYDGLLDNTIMYSAGLWLGGVVGGETRVTVAEYSQEYGPGPMTGGTYQPDAMWNEDYRVYKLYTDSLEANPSQDYYDWPADQGAPVDGSGRPELRGDRMLWAVFNDADPSLHTNSSGYTQPLGVEVRQRIWAVDEDGVDELWRPHYLNVWEHSSSRVGVVVEVVDYDALTGHDYMVVTTGLANPTTATWELHNLTLGGYLPLSQPDITIYGMHITVSVGHPSIESWEWGPDPDLRPLTSVDWGGSGFYGGMGLGWELFATSLNDDQYIPIEIYWQGDGAGQSGYCYRRDEGFSYDGYHPNQNITVWDISTDPARQLNVAFTEYYQPSDDAGQEADSVWNPGEQLNLVGDLDNLGGREYLFVLNSDYSATEDPLYTVDGAVFGPPEHDFDCVVFGWVRGRPGTDGKPDEGEYLRIFPQSYDIANDTFTFSSAIAPAQTTGPNGVSIYIEYKLYNEGGNNIDDCYISLWSDPDLGGHQDDLVGCDTLNDIHFCYNGYATDNSYQSSPPAVGYRLLYGPVVPSPDDTAYFDGSPMPGYKNLGMSTFTRYINGTDPDNAYESYNYMQGLMADGSPYMYDGQMLKYHHSGDPVAQTGDLDTGPADRRMMCSLGPFDFYPGDSQYVLLKFAVGQGNDYLSSITKLKEILNIPFELPSCCINRGDLNHADGPIPADISDLTYMVDYIFGGGPPPVCYEEGDLNASGFVDITDLTYLVDFIFGGGPPGVACP